MSVTSGEKRTSLIVLQCPLMTESERRLRVYFFDESKSRAFWISLIGGNKSSATDNLNMCEMLLTCAR